MFSLATTFFYMLSAYFAFLVGYSLDLPQWLVFFVPAGFVSGYLLDRISSVKKLWAEDQFQFVRLVVRNYVMFFFFTAAIFMAGQYFASM